MNHFQIVCGDTSNVLLQSQQRVSTGSSAKHSIFDGNEVQWLLMYSHTVLRCRCRFLCSTLLSHARLQGRWSTVVLLPDSQG